MKTSLALLAAGFSTLAFGAAFASPVQPFDNSQPSLVINELMTPSGIFPSGGGGGVAYGDTLGFVYGFAGPFAPSGTYSTSGQLVPINQNPALFSILGTTYGGDGASSFGLPNLQGQPIIGAGSGAGLTPRTLGVPVGSSSVTLTSAQVPAPGHLSAAAPYNTVQPSLPLTPLIAIAGDFPSQGGNSGPAAFLGQIAWFAGNYVPSGWAVANGQTLSISQNTALFSVLGTTYGGNGQTTFALPYLLGRIVIGADAANPLGSEKGSETYTVNRSELPGPGQQPLDDDQPSLAVTYLIATSGVFPSRDGDPFDQNLPTLGQIVAFAGDYAPAGWAFAEGQLLPIAQNTGCSPSWARPTAAMA